MRRMYASGAVALVLAIVGSLPAQVVPQRPGAPPPTGRGSPQGAAREALTRKPATAQETRKVKVFRLRSASAAEVARVVREMFNSPHVRPSGQLTLAVFEPANALIVQAGEDDLERVAGLLQILESQDPTDRGARVEVRVLELGRLEPDDALERSLQLVFRGPGASRFVLDRGRRVVVASADQATLAAAEALLRRLGELPQPGPEAPQARRAGMAGQAEATFVVEFRDLPWRRAFEWLTDASGRPVIARPTLAGTVTLSSHGQRYSLTEVVDLLNEQLLPRYLLIRRERSFVLVPADEKVDPALVPRVRAEDLEARGRTELVSVAFPLQTVPAGQAAAEVKKMVGPFGEVVTDPKNHHLVVQDTAGNLRRIRRVFQPDRPGNKE